MRAFISTGQLSRQMPRMSYLLSVAASTKCTGLQMVPPHLTARLVRLTRAGHVDHSTDAILPCWSICAQTQQRTYRSCPARQSTLPFVTRSRQPSWRTWPQSRLFQIRMGAAQTRSMRYVAAAAAARPEPATMHQLYQYPRARSRLRIGGRWGYAAQKLAVSQTRVCLASVAISRAFDEWLHTCARVEG